ncbi:hypothetical protein H696_04068 [Fonticula alba]|uniref:Uncharacterized protein n=1 Tax=Fonticula alba TaxID=691883 RepID=A0A058Z6U2_FONAL|nr:hypothetical protein H696_04068 [Fonticula alba]KCV69653.1 hypothetical protein H696_04068 [Fonticula alba]|eukprot:XP_009496218.1 hypothetical protein H696_04068 [Fonticula alba]
MDLKAAFDEILAAPMATTSFWKDLFLRYVFHTATSSDLLADDLLFYVKLPIVDGEVADLPAEDLLIVRRRTEPNAIPSDEESLIINWRETFYLNTVVQLNFQLMVAVCTRRSVGTEVALEAHRHVAKRVYASPNMTRMDQKGHDYAVSYPLIYFIVEDFEDAFANIIIHENEYLCVEVSVNFQVPDQQGSVVASTSVSQKLNIPTQQTPDRPMKVTIFQGAVNWQALLNTFQKQQVSTLPFTRAAASSSGDRVEYIMMRGPGDKGHTQVAVSVPPAASASGDLGASDSTDSLRQGLMRGWARLQQTVQGRYEPIAQLRTQLTFVNIHWTSIINDIMDVYYGKYNPSGDPKFTTSRPAPETPLAAINTARHLAQARCQEMAAASEK